MPIRDRFSCECVNMHPADFAGTRASAPNLSEAALDRPRRRKMQPHALASRDEQAVGVPRDVPAKLVVTNVRIDLIVPRRHRSRVLQVVRLHALHQHVRSTAEVETDDALHRVMHRVATPQHACGRAQQWPQVASVARPL